MTDIWTSMSASMRKAWVLGLYRWIIGVAFLFAAFSAFPSAKWVIGLGLLVFNSAVEAIGFTAELLAGAANIQADQSERKTRHTIVAAAERGGFGDGEPEFWREVERRVAEEMTPDEPAGFWKSAGLMVGALSWRLVADIFGIGLVMALTSGSSPY